MSKKVRTVVAPKTQALKSAMKTYLGHLAVMDDFSTTGRNSLIIETWEEMKRKQERLAEEMKEAAREEAPDSEDGPLFISQHPGVVLRVSAPVETPIYDHKTIIGTWSSTAQLFVLRPDPAAVKTAVEHGVVDQKVANDAMRGASTRAAAVAIFIGEEAQVIAEGK